MILLAAYIVGVVGLAAGMTLVVVKVFPTKDDGDKGDGKTQPSTNDSASGGRLFRRAKREGTEAAS